MPISTEFLTQLLEQPESDYLDFKQQFGNENCYLVHDILCLANSETEDVRYLILGIEDATKKICGIENDPNRKTQVQVINLLYGARISKIPKLTLQQVNIEDHEVAVITIEPGDQRPFILTTDYRHGSKTVRAGVVYTRHGDMNTPINGTAPEAEIEIMFRQRLHLDKPPLERIRHYLRDTANWQYGYNQIGLYFYYSPFPEFTIQVLEDREDFDESWVREFPDISASRAELYIQFHSTRLASQFIVWCDGARLAVVMPNSKTMDVKGDQSEFVCSYFYVEDSVELLLQGMIDAVYPQSSRFYVDKVFGYFPNRPQAETNLEADWKDGVKSYTFYRFDQKDRRYHRISPDGDRVLRDKERL